MAKDHHRNAFIRLDLLRQAIEMFAGQIVQRGMHDTPIRLGDLLVDAIDRQQRLPVAPLLLERGNDYILLPGDDCLLQAGDQLLFASPLAAQRCLEMTLRNANELDYVLSGRENSGSLLGRLLASR